MLPHAKIKWYPQTHKSHTSWRKDQLHFVCTEMFIHMHVHTKWGNKKRQETRKECPVPSAFVFQAEYMAVLNLARSVKLAKSSRVAIVVKTLHYLLLPPPYLEQGSTSFSISSVFLDHKIRTIYQEWKPISWCYLCFSECQMFWGLLGRLYHSYLAAQSFAGPRCQWSGVKIEVIFPKPCNSPLQTTS